MLLVLPSNFFLYGHFIWFNRSQTSSFSRDTVKEKIIKCQLYVVVVLCCVWGVEEGFFSVFFFKSLPSFLFLQNLAMDTKTGENTNSQFFCICPYQYRSENIVLVIGLIHKHSPWLMWEEEENTLL